jgi:hypothetical protein
MAARDHTPAPVRGSDLNLHPSLAFQDSSLSL